MVYYIRYFTYVQEYHSSVTVAESILTVLDQYASSLVIIIFNSWVIDRVVYDPMFVLRDLTEKSTNPERIRNLT